MRKLKREYGISDVALAWFESYLADRYQIVQTGDCLSVSVCLDTGVPQGLGSGPGQYTKHTRGLGSIIRDLMKLFHFSQTIPSCLKKLTPTPPKTELKVENN